MTHDVLLNADHALDWAYENGKIIGFFLEHPNTETGEPCGGFIPLGRGEWQIKAIMPLTIVPSVDCFDCKDHGTILRGEWVAARDNYAHYFGGHMMTCVDSNLFRACEWCRENPKGNFVLRFLTQLMRFARVSKV